MALRVSARQLHLLQELGYWARGRRKRVRINGESMNPTLRSGSFVFVDPHAWPNVGDIVVATVELQTGPQQVIKRVTSVNETTITLHSDNLSVGTDSRTWGPISRAAVDGVVTLIPSQGDDGGGTSWGRPPIG